MNVERRLLDNTIPVLLDGRLLRNSDLLRGVLRHEIAEVNHLLKFQGQTFSTNRAAQIASDGHQMGLKAQGY